MVFPRDTWMKTFAVTGIVEPSVGPALTDASEEILRTVWH
jgi:hypothetical protein